MQHQNTQWPWKKGEAPASKTLVFGAAVGYSPEQISPFLTSLRRTGYAGDIALIVDKRKLKSYQRLALFSNVDLIGQSPWPPVRFPSLKSVHGRRWIWHPVQSLLWYSVKVLSTLPVPELFRSSLRSWLGQYLYPPTESRFLRYAQYLRQHPYERILITDTRDVLFQRDPFDMLPANGLAVSMESRAYCIGSENWNASKIRQIYGKEMLVQVGDQPVSCSGVTYGDAACMRRYLDLMGHEIYELSRRMARIGWFDQALHNVVIWQRWKDGLILLETLDSAVATLGAVDEGGLRFDEKGYLLNRDGTVIAILHQYDRLKASYNNLLKLLARTPEVPDYA